MTTYHSFSLVETKRLAKRLALETRLRLRTKKRTGFRDGATVFALSGELGTGKTAFIQGFLNGLGIRRRAISPTFILMRRFGRVYHADAYRIKNPAEFAKLGWADILSDPRNIVLLEWADKVKRLVPKGAVWIKFKHGGKENERVIQIKNKL